MLRYLKNFKNKYFFTTWILISVLLSASLFAYYSSGISNDVMLEVEVLENEDSRNQEGEVWIKEISFGEDKIPLGLFVSAENGWRIEGNMLLGTLKSKKLGILMTNNTDLKVVFLKHPWSSSAKLVKNNEDDGVLNLYSEERTEYEYIVSGSHNYFIAIIYGMIVLIFSGFALLLLSVVYDSTRGELIKEKVKVRWIFYYTVCMTFFWSFYLLAFYPAIMSNDSISQWNQMIGNEPYYNWHPVLHTLLNALVTKIWLTPASIATFQIIVLSVSIACGIYVLRCMGLSKKFGWVICLLYSLFPVNGFMSISLWKDIPYASILLLATCLLVQLVRSNGELLNNKLWIISMTLLLWLCYFIRHNGFVPVIFTLLFVFITYKKYYKNIIAIGVALIILISFTHGVYNKLEVNNSPSGLKYMMMVHNVSKMLHDGVHFDEKDIQYLENVLPIDIWKSGYYPYSTNPLLFYNNNGVRFKIEFISENESEFLKIWFKYAIQNIDLVLKDIIDMNSLMLEIAMRNGNYVYTTQIMYKDELAQHTQDYNNRKSEVVTIVSNPNGIENIVVSSKLTNIISKCYDLTMANKLMILFWRPAIEFYVLLIAFFGLLLKHKRVELLLPFACTAMNLISIAIATQAQDYRYLYSMVIATPILLGYAVLISNPCEDRNVKV